MLSRTADNLYWLSRYVERADCLARILDVAQRLSHTPVTYGGSTNEWSSAVLTAGCTDGFIARHGPLENATEENVVSFLAFDPANPSSIRNSFEVARTNARSVRTALTSEMWDVINSAWIELRAFPDKAMTREELARFLAFVKETSLRFDGATFRTMLRNDAYWFSRVGAHVERADNTARILDVKYHVLLPEKEHVGGPLDYFQWASILRSVSALTAFHWVYREQREAVAGGGPADPEPPDAALARRLLRQPVTQPRRHRRRLWPAGPGPAPCPRDARQAVQPFHRGHLSGGTARIHQRFHRRQL